jgi:hypothetical protein
MSDLINGITVQNGDASNSESNPTVITLNTAGNATVSGDVTNSSDNKDWYSFTALGDGLGSFSTGNIVGDLWFSLYENGSYVAAFDSNFVGEDPETFALTSNYSLDYQLTAGAAYTIGIDADLFLDAPVSYNLTLDTPEYVEPVIELETEYTPDSVNGVIISGGEVESFNNRSYDFDENRITTDANGYAEVTGSIGYDGDQADSYTFSSDAEGETIITLTGVSADTYLTVEFGGGAGIIQSATWDNTSQSYTLTYEFNPNVNYGINIVTDIEQTDYALTVNAPTLEQNPDGEVIDGEGESQDTDWVYYYDNAGTDTVRFIGSSVDAYESASSYSPENSSTSFKEVGAARIEDGVERLIFTDGALAFDIDGLAGQAYRIYKAAFDRIPDEAGLGFWINALDNGADMTNDVAYGFTHSDEFISLYGANSTDEQYVDLLYANVLDREADQDGYDFWIGHMDAGRLTREDVLIHFSESEENQANVIDLIANGIQYDEWIA